MQARAPGGTRAFSPTAPGTARNTLGMDSSDMRHRAETIETIEKISIETIEYGADAPLPALRHQHQHPPLPRGFADVHMHTNYSDGTGSVEDVLRFAQEHTRLDVIAITDHDTIEGALRARDLAARDDD